MLDSPLRTLFPALALLALGPVQVVGAQSPGPSFDQLDRDGDGAISRDEARARRGLSELMPHFDDNGDGRLDPAEFHALIVDAVKASGSSLGANPDTGHAADEVAAEPEVVESSEPVEDSRD